MLRRNGAKMLWWVLEVWGSHIGKVQSIRRGGRSELGGVAPLPRVENRVRPSLSRTSKTKLNVLGYYGQSVDSFEVYLNALTCVSLGDHIGGTVYLYTHPRLVHIQH